MPNQPTVNTLENIPQELRVPAMWLQYYLKPDPKKPDKKPTKHPCVKYSTPEYRTANLRSLDHLLTRPQQAGFQRLVDKAEGFIFVDIDKVRNPETGDIEPWANDIIYAFNTYCEVSASGKGLHLVCRGVLDEDFHIDPHQVEIYSGNIPNKLIAMTGDTLDFNVAIQDCQEQATELMGRVKSETRLAQPEQEIPPPVVPKKSTTFVVYPFWAWEGTPYHDFAVACTKGNHIPKRFFVEALKTTVGAICGHRLRIPDSGLQARFYTVMLTNGGGMGKSTALEAVARLFVGTGLVNSESVYENIGCFRGGFGSGPGLLKRFMDSPRVLQQYDELATMVEKLGIKGSGQGFLGAINTLYESDMFPSNITKETDLSTSTPQAVFNSILGCSIQEKWEEMFSSTSADNSGFFQRLNIVYAENVKLVARIYEPDLTQISEALVAKIKPLEASTIVLDILPSAQQILDIWFSSFHEETKGLPGEVTGRTNVLVLRNAMQIAWLLGRAVIDDDAMRRAIALGEYAWRTRLLCHVAPGKNDVAKLQGQLKKVLSVESPLTRSVLSKRIHAERLGLELLNRALAGAETEGWIFVERGAASATKAGYRGGRKREVIHWVGE